MDILINKKTPAECFSELCCFVKTTKKNFKGFDYREIEDFYNLLWDVFGKTNVMISQPAIPAPVYTTLPTGQVICSVYVEITIYNDNGEVFRTFGSWGEAELVYSDKSNRFDGLGNVIDIAKAKAVKLCCKEMDAFGNYSYNRSDTTSEPTEKPSKKNISRGVFVLKGTEPIVELRVDKTTGLPVYTWKCENESGAFNIVFYPNKYKDCADWINRLVAQSKNKPNTLIEIKASKLDVKEGITQLMFEGKN